MAKRRGPASQRGRAAKRQCQPELDKSGRLLQPAAPDFINPEDRDPCQVCGKLNDYETFLLCDGCNHGTHTYCAGLEAVPDGMWLCASCKKEPTLDSAIRQVLYMAGPQGLSFTLLLQRLRQIPTVQCTTVELMSALKKDSDRTEPNEVELIISETESEPTDDNNARDSCLPESQALNPEASEPQTLDQQAETPLSPDNRDCMTDAECAPPATDTYSTDASDSKPKCRNATDDSTQKPTQPAVHPPQNVGSLGQLKQRPQAAGAMPTPCDLDVLRQCFAVAGVCKHAGLNSEVQMGAVAAFMFYIQTHQPAIQADTHRALPEPAHGSKSPAHGESSAMELLGVSNSPAHQEASPEKPLEISDTQGLDNQQQVVHDMGNPSAAVAARPGHGNIAPKMKKSSEPPVVVPADLQQQAACEDNVGTEDAKSDAATTSAAAQRGPEQDSYQKQLPVQSQQAFTALKKVMAAAPEPLDPKTKLRVLQQILKQVPGLNRYEEAFDNLLLTLEGALAGLMVDEVYRVLHVVSQAQSLELMIDNFVAFVRIC